MNVAHLLRAAAVLFKHLASGGHSTLVGVHGVCTTIFNVSNWPESTIYYTGPRIAYVYW